MRTEDLHDELVAAILAAGAVEPESILPKEYNGKRVDAVFKSERVLVEVKSLVEDQVAVESLSRRVTPIFQRWARHGGPVVFGTVSLPWETMPEGMRHEFDAALAPRIEQNLKDANRQFRETRNALSWNSSLNVIVVIAPNTFRLNPGIIGRVAWNQLSRRKRNLPEIDLVTAITVPVLDQPGSVNRPLEVINFPRRQHASIAEAGAKIGQAWANHFTAKTGVVLKRLSRSEEQFFDDHKMIEINQDQARRCKPKN